MATVAELQTAYDDLVSGQAVARVRDENGEEVLYARADADKLLRRIRELEQAATTAVEGPLRVFF